MLMRNGLIVGYDTPYEHAMLNTYVATPGTATKFPAVAPLTGCPQDLNEPISSRKALPSGKYDALAYITGGGPDKGSGIVSAPLEIDIAPN